MVLLACGHHEWALLLRGVPSIKKNSMLIMSSVWHPLKKWFAKTVLQQGLKVQFCHHGKLKSEKPNLWLPLWSLKITTRKLNLLYNSTSKTAVYYFSELQKIALRAHMKHLFKVLISSSRYKMFFEFEQVSSGSIRDTIRDCSANKRTRPRHGCDQLRRM